MRHDEDGADAHQRGQPHGRPRIVREGQEGAAIRDDAAMQRQPVDGGRHAVLADAVVDVALAVVQRGDVLGLAGLGVVGAGQVGGAADGLGHQPVDDLQRHFRRLAGGHLRPVGGQLLLVFDDRGVEALRQVAPDAALELGPQLRIGLGQAALPVGAGLGARLARLRQLRECRPSPRRRRIPVEELAEPRSPRPRAAACALRARLGGRPKPMVVRQAMRHGFRSGGPARWRRRSPRGRGRRPAWRPSRRRGSGELVGGIGSDTGPSWNVVMVPEDDQLVELEVPGERSAPPARGPPSAAVAAITKV